MANSAITLHHCAGLEIATADGELCYSVNTNSGTDTKASALGRRDHAS